MRLRDLAPGRPTLRGRPAVRLLTAIRCGNTTSDDTCQAGINLRKTEAPGTTAVEVEGSLSGKLNVSEVLWHDRTRTPRGKSSADHRSRAERIRARVRVCQHRQY